VSPVQSDSADSGAAAIINGEKIMIVTMRPGIAPKCTRHRLPMKLYEFGEPTGPQ
jgi:hypothetical protein